MKKIEKILSKIEFPEVDFSKHQMELKGRLIYNPAFRQENIEMDSIINLLFGQRRILNGGIAALLITVVISGYIYLQHTDGNDGGIIGTRSILAASEEYYEEKLEDDQRYIYQKIREVRVVTDVESEDIKAGDTVETIIETWLDTGRNLIRQKQTTTDGDILSDIIRTPRYAYTIDQDNQCQAFNNVPYFYLYDGIVSYFQENDDSDEAKLNKAIGLKQQLVNEKDVVGYKNRIIGERTSALILEDSNFTKEKLELIKSLQYFDNVETNKSVEWQDEKVIALTLSIEFEDNSLFKESYYFDNDQYFFKGMSWGSSSSDKKNANFIEVIEETYSNEPFDLGINLNLCQMPDEWTDCTSDNIESCESYQNAKEVYGCQKKVQAMDKRLYSDYYEQSVCYEFEINQQDFENLSLEEIQNKFNLRYPNENTELFKNVNPEYHHYTRKEIIDIAKEANIDEAQWTELSDQEINSKLKSSGHPELILEKDLLYNLPYSKLLEMEDWQIINYLRKKQISSLIKNIYEQL